MIEACGQLPAMVTSLNVTAGEGLQLSFASALPVLAGAVLAVQVMVVLAGQVNTGGVESIILMTWLQVDELPHASMIVHKRVITIGHDPDTTSI